MTAVVLSLQYLLPPRQYIQGKPTYNVEFKDKEDMMKDGALSPIFSVNLLTGQILNPEVFKDKTYENWLQRHWASTMGRWGGREKALVKCTLKVTNGKRELTYRYSGPAVPLFSPLRDYVTDGELYWEIDVSRDPEGIPDYRAVTINNRTGSDRQLFFDWVQRLSSSICTTKLQDDPKFLQFASEVRLGCERCYNEFYSPPSIPDASFSAWWVNSKAYLRSLPEYDSETLLQYQRASKLINLYVSSSREDIQTSRYLDVIRPLDLERARTAVQVQYNAKYLHFRGHYSMFPHTHQVTPGSPTATIPIPADSVDKPLWITECLDLMQRDLRRIIAGAPPTTTPFIVYRGLTKPFGTMSGAMRHYTGFLSTSGDYVVADEFRGPYGSLLCITVPPGQRCLLLGVYKIQTECEVLFAPRTQLQIDTYDSSRSSPFQGKNPLFVTIAHEPSLAGVKRDRS